MANVDIYSTKTCPYCDRAKDLLNNKGVSYREVMIDQDPSGRDEMLKRAPDARTVPQIFIADTHVGGFDQLWALEQAGKLDALLAQSS